MVTSKLRTGYWCPSGCGAGRLARPRVQRLEIGKLRGQPLAQRHPRCITEKLLRLPDVSVSVAHVAQCSLRVFDSRRPTAQLLECLDRVAQRYPCAAGDIEDVAYYPRRGCGAHVRFHHVGDIGEVARLPPVPKNDELLG